MRTSIPLVRNLPPQPPFAGELNLSASRPAQTALAIDKAGADSLDQAREPSLSAGHLSLSLLVLETLASEPDSNRESEPAHHRPFSAALYYSDSIRHSPHRRYQVRDQIVSLRPLTRLPQAPPGIDQPGSPTRARYPARYIQEAPLQHRSSA